ncbi:FkbM family methyltransferase [Rubripirellula amarantea]|nr:FkbM family methyltransferase [Rubripirellula amarantea]
MFARSPDRILKALTHHEHYLALWNMSRVYDQFWANFKRYITKQGEYPYQPGLATPQGRVNPMLHCPADMLTVNEIFCRKDYDADSSINVVVDIGSNIGISGLYFLTRNDHVRCYLYEPDPANIPKLESNLASYKDRYTLYENAVSYESGRLQFGTEPTGRYGGLGVSTGNYIEVETITINDVLADVLSKETHVDILKLDIEGLEVDTVSAIDPKYLDKIGRIYFEYMEPAPVTPIFPSEFRQNQRGSIYRMFNKLEK